MRTVPLVRRPRSEFVPTLPPVDNKQCRRSNHQNEGERNENGDDIVHGSPSALGANGAHEASGRSPELVVSVFGTVDLGQQTPVE